ncbi:unnamed protein product, partial [marine sediment metagenome]
FQPLAGYQKGGPAMGLPDNIDSTIEKKHPSSQNHQSYDKKGYQELY